MYLSFKKLKSILISVLLMALVGCNEIELFSAIEEYEANDMLVILMREGIGAEREKNSDGTYKIILSNKKATPQAIAALKLRGHPQKKHENLCSTFKGEGMVTTPLEQKARYNCAKSQELSGALSDIDGVVRAHVVLELSETDPISRKVKPATASVLLKYKKGIHIDTLIPKVKELVTYGISNMVYTNVKVIAIEEKVQNQTYNMKPREAEIMETTPNLMASKNDPFDKVTTNFFLYIFIGILATMMLAFLLFIVRFKKGKSRAGNQRNITNMAPLSEHVTYQQDTNPVDDF